MRLGEPYELSEVTQLGRIPEHIAIIMDGNGRWAAYQGRARTDGHRSAKQPLIDCILSAIELRVPWLTIYAFSEENWTRPDDELNVILNFGLRGLTRKDAKALVSRGVRFRFLGNIGDVRIPAPVREWFQKLAKVSIDNSRLQLTIAFNYSGQQEIVDAARRALELGIEPCELTPERLTSLMDIPDMPSVDLFVRTSGEQRLSNFMLWRVAYAELVFMETLWPDFTAGHLRSAIIEFQNRERRFGGLPGPATSPSTHS